MSAVSELSHHVLSGMDRIIVGQERLKAECLTVLLCEGHALVEGAPGLAKTLTIKTLSRLLRLDYQRVQCTTDLMPADIIGTNVVNLASGTFQFHQGRYSRTCFSSTKSTGCRPALRQRCSNAWMNGRSLSMAGAT